MKSYIYILNRALQCLPVGDSHEIASEKPGQIYCQNRGCGMTAFQKDTSGPKVQGFQSAKNVV